MIVVDASVIVHLLLPGEHTDQADALRRSDPDWIAPVLVRSELRNVLATLMRNGGLTLDQALATMALAEELLHRRTYRLPSPLVLECAESSGLTAYDCEYVALAREMEVSLATTDKQILERHPNLAVPLTSYA